MLFRRYYYYYYYSVEVFPVLNADEEKVEDEADGLQFEVVPHSIETEPGYSRGSKANADGMQNNINDFFYQYFLQRFRSLNLSR